MYRNLSLKLALLPIAAAMLVAAASSASATEHVSINELIDLIRQQQTQIDALRAEVSTLARGAGQAAPTEGNADRLSKAVVSRYDKVNLSITGHINRALLLADDGDQSDLFHVDNDTEPTLINFVGTYDATDDLTIGGRFEAQFASNASNAVSQNTENAAVGSVNFSERHLEVYFDSKRFGKLSLGQGDTASEGASEVDLSGTKIVIRSNFGTFGAGVLFRNSTTNTLSAVSIGNAFDNFDGLSRDERVRYDTPSFAGFKVSGSAVQGGALDFALRYAGDFGGAQAAAAVAVANRASTSTTIDTQWSGSGSVLFGNGINLTLAGGGRDLKAGASDDPIYYYGKLGYRASIFEVGKTSFSIEAGRENDLAANGDEATVYGLGVAQRLSEWNTELYAGIRLYELDRPGASFDDITAGMLGAIFTF